MLVVFLWMANTYVGYNFYLKYGFHILWSYIVLVSIFALRHIYRVRKCLKEEKRQARERSSNLENHIRHLLNSPSFINHRDLKPYFSSDYWQWITNLNHNSNQSLAIIDQWKEDFPKEAMDTVFELTNVYLETRTKYMERIDKGESMLLLLPEAYQNVETMMVVYQLLEEGRADTWKESINLLKQENFQNQLLQEIKQTYQAIDKFSDRLADMGDEIRKELEWSAYQSQLAYDKQENYNNLQSQLLAENNQLQKNQLHMTSTLLIQELLK